LEVSSLASIDGSDSPHARGLQPRRLLQTCSIAPPVTRSPVLGGEGLLMTTVGLCLVEMTQA
jgi:hypothetical protein